MSPTEIPVVVVGAGPAGFAAALQLRARGLPVTLLEAEPEDRVRPGSRALFVHQESLRLLDEASPGLAERIVRHGTVWPTKRTFYGGRQVFARTYPPAKPGRLPRFTSLRQIETERHLHAACLAAGVDITWGARVVTAVPDERGVSLGGAEGQTWRARYVVAADGAHSAVRKAIGIPWQGKRSEGFHVVVDIADRGPGAMPPERVFHYRHPALGGRNVMRVPFAGGFQVDLQCGQEDDVAEFAEPDAVRQWLPEVVDAKYADAVLWVSKYHYLHVVAESLVDTHRRVLLIGEAAHLFPPFGARGMNSGFADGSAAAEAVATALAAGGAAATKAVETFDHARGLAARYNSDAARTALSHMRPTSPLMRWRQRAAAALSPVIPRMGSWLEHAPYGPRAGATPSGKY
ncbi:FAD-dependent monooxygenase [Amycolatopsis taiwanensis]|uniref:Monooxygenase n=1 Tax=Amycolatopsis taiwanensis TaxID=342230 RepID=A0A9W6VKL3_9PSEU|nr:FAD-dependent monooxygenase [Amycolatopsis taiwanensis]GLY70567.1 putative monooxygenase [Amycolatopsis taiwanensis]